MSETAKPKARTRAKAAAIDTAISAEPARKPRAGRTATAPEAETVTAEPAKPRPPRKRASAAAREDLRTQAIAAFTAAQGSAVSHLSVQKNRARREIRIIARVDGAPRQMRWSYADGTLNPLAA